MQERLQQLTAAVLAAGAEFAALRAELGDAITDTYRRTGRVPPLATIERLDRDVASLMASVGFLPMLERPDLVTDARRRPTTAEALLARWTDYLARELSARPPAA